MPIQDEDFIMSDDFETTYVGDPADPICIGCGKRPHELSCYTVMVDAEIEDSGGERVEGDDYKSLCRMYVIHEEGTYNRRNGHFLCDGCYIKNGSPSSPTGWKAP